MTPEQALQRLVDKDEIIDLIHRYSHCVDRRLYDELASLFTEDCEVDYGPGVAPVARGRKAFRAMFGSGGGFAATSHHNANVLISFESEDVASVTTSLYAWHRTPDGATPQVWGCYNDTVKRTPDGWQFASRQLRVAGNENWESDWLPLLDRDERPT